jgi:OmpA-OmpF porin, OOP family
MKWSWVAAMALASGAALAQQPPGKYYVGLDVGRSWLEATQSATFFGPEVSRQDGHDLGFKALFGIQVSRYFAVEAGYVDFGDFDVQAIPYDCGTGAPPPCTFDVTASTRGPSTNLVGLWPFAEHWSLSFRAGAQYAQISVTERDPDVAGSTEKHDDASWGVLYGAGINYQVTPRLRARLNWERNEQIEFGLGLGGGATVFDLGSSSLTSLGVDYRF